MKRNWTVLIGLGVLVALLGGCKMVWRSVRYNIPSVTDYKLWQERPVTKAGTVHNFVDGRDTGIAPLSEWGLGKWYKPGMTTEDYMKKTGTVAFVVLRGDTLLYEYYGDDFADTSRFNVFSMTKAYMSTLTGIAVGEGKIKSIDQSISEYLPWCIDSAICKITIRDLLQMTSGLKSNEGYLNPWGTSTKMYYGYQMPKIMRDLQVKYAPGTRYFYQNVNSQLLGMIVRRAVGKPLATYLSEKIWEPMGMEADAGWSLAEGTDEEKAFCCLNARARDFARFGLLVLNQGNWKGKQLIPREWLAEVARIDTSRGANNRYHFNWFLTPEQDDFWAEGLLGQFTYICPKTRTVIVRIGNSLDFKVPWYDSFKILAGLKEKPVPMDFTKRDLKPYAGKFVFGLSNFGDTTLAGKEAIFVAKRKGLKVKTNFQKTWYALPQSDSVFYHIGFGRMLNFHKDEQGQFNRMHWNRRGNIWELGRNEK